MAAWRGLGAFEGRASIRTWLYSIATRRCLNMRRAARRRPTSQAPALDWQPPEPTRLGEVVWLEPYPDVLLQLEAANLWPKSHDLSQRSGGKTTLIRV